MIRREEDRSSVFQDLAGTLSEQRGGFPGDWRPCKAAGRLAAHELLGTDGAEN